MYALVNLFLWLAQFPGSSSAEARTWKYAAAFVLAKLPCLDNLHEKRIKQ